MRHGDRAPRGFTLIELMVAVLLGALVLMGLGAVYATIVRLQTQSYKKDVLQDSALVSLKSLARDLQRATAMVTPSWPCPNGDCAAAGGGAQAADHLIGCVNWDSMPPAKAIDATQPVRTFWYCVDDATQKMYAVWQEGTGVTCPPAYTGSCPPSAPPTGGGMYVVANDVNRDPDNAGQNCGVSGNNYFCRPANLNNVVEMHYVVGSGTASMTVNTAVALPKPFNAPFE